MHAGNRQTESSTGSTGQAVWQISNRRIDYSNKMFKLNEVQQRVALSRSSIYLMMKGRSSYGAPKIGKQTVA
jgi:predicted DNA-binding transcriptional regulator AlpA